MSRLFVIGLLTLGSYRAIAEEPAAQFSVKTGSKRESAIEVKLELFEHKIKIGRSIFVRTHIRNRSKKPMIIHEWVYRGSADLAEEWSKNCELKLGNFVEIQDSRGHPVEPGIYIARYDSNPFEQTASTIDTATSKLIDELKAKGLSDAEINSKLREEVVARERRAREEKYPPVELNQGKAVKSISWCSKLRDSELKDSVCPGAGFVELPFFAFEKPGKYRIRGVVDSYLDPNNRRVRTDWIPFEVFK